MAVFLHIYLFRVVPALVLQTEYITFHPQVVETGPFFPHTALEQIILFFPPTIFFSSQKVERLRLGGQTVLMLSHRQNIKI